LLGERGSSVVKYEFPELDIEITDFVNGDAARIDVDIKESDLTKYKWILFDWSDRSFSLIELPEVGASLDIQGMPFR